MSPPSSAPTSWSAADWGRYLGGRAGNLRGAAGGGHPGARSRRPGARQPLLRRQSGSILAASPSTGTAPSCSSLPGAPRGAAVLLHGLTDAPYSQRHVARLYQEHGFVAVVPRLPGHGTVPGALTDAVWEDWAAATRLAVREARRRVGPGLPLHLVGFSNGGALAVQYALDALENRELRRPDRLVLISPMIGVTAFARFAGIAGWPAVFPAFAKAAWLADPARVHSVQVQFVPGSRRPPVASAHAGPAATADAPRAREPTHGPAADADLPVGRRLYRQHTRDHHGPLCAIAGQRQRAGPVRPEPIVRLDIPN